MSDQKQRKEALFLPSVFEGLGALQNMLIEQMEKKETVTSVDVFCGKDISSADVADYTHASVWLLPTKLHFLPIMAGNSYKIDHISYGNISKFVAQEKKVHAYEINFNERRLYDHFVCGDQRSLANLDILSPCYMKKLQKLYTFLLNETLDKLIAQKALEKAIDDSEKSLI